MSLNIIKFFAFGGIFLKLMVWNQHWEMIRGHSMLLSEYIDPPNLSRILHPCKRKYSSLHCKKRQMFHNLRKCKKQNIR